MNGRTPAAYGRPSSDGGRIYLEDYNKYNTMAKFIYQEIGGITKNGERIVKPRFVGNRQVSSDRFLTEVAKKSALTKGTLQAVITTIADMLPQYLAQGDSVRIEGLGLFTPTLAMNNNMPVREIDEKGHEVQHNAQNVTFGTVRITADKELIKAAKLLCHPIHDRYQGNRRAMDTPYTREQRTGLAIEFLEQHSTLTVADYMRLTGLRHTKAAQELRELSTGSEACLEAHGRGSHRYYTK